MDSCDRHCICTLCLLNVDSLFSASVIGTMRAESWNLAMLTSVEAEPDSSLAGLVQLGVSLLVAFENAKEG